MRSVMKRIIFTIFCGIIFLAPNIYSWRYRGNAESQQVLSKQALVNRVYKILIADASSDLADVAIELKKYCEDTTYHFSDGSKEILKSLSLMDQNNKIREDICELLQMALDEKQKGIDDIMNTLAMKNKGHLPIILVPQKYLFSTDSTK